MFEKGFGNTSKNFSLERLRRLVEVLEAGYISKASGGNVTTAALISRQITELESFFEVPLREKHGKLVKLSKEGEELASLHKQIVIKVPMIEEGVKAIRYFSDKGLKTNCTLIFSSGQALLAAKAGATYVSPFIGRLDDISTDGLDLISDIRDIYDNYAYETEILAASIRHTMHIIDCAKIGADVITSPLSAIKGLLKHPLTDIGLEKFLSDHKKGS